MPPQPFPDEREPALRLQLVARPRERRVQLPHPPPQYGIPQVRTVHRRPHEARVERGEGCVGAPLCGTNGGSNDTVSCGVPCSCRSNS